MNNLTHEEQAELRTACIGDICFSDLSESVSDKLYERFYNEMPYGTAKGRTGTPEDWYVDNIEEIETWIGVGNE